MHVNLHLSQNKNFNFKKLKMNGKSWMCLSWLWQFHYQISSSCTLLNTCSLLHINYVLRKLEGKRYSILLPLSVLEPIGEPSKMGIHTKRGWRRAVREASAVTQSWASEPSTVKRGLYRRVAWCGIGVYITQLPHTLLSKH